jgi:zinc transport system permease protein
LVLTLALALVVAVAIKVVGALLIVALLLVPAAAARPFSRTPERMAAAAAGIGAVAALTGLEASVLADTPTGPTIVCAAAVLFALSTAIFAHRH